MKILFGMPEATARGGINACEPPFLRELKSRATEIREEIYSFDNPAGLSIIDRARNVIKTARKFRRLLRNENFDVFHINTAFDKNALLRDAFTLFFIGKTRTKFFIKLHGSDANLLKDDKLKPLIRSLIRRAAAIGVLSSEEKQNFVIAGYPADKFHVVKNAVTVSSEENPARDFIFDGSRPIRLLFVSRLIHSKGLFEALKAVSVLKENVVLNVLGDGEIKTEAEMMAKKLKIDNMINFQGFVSENTVREFYRKSDVLVFPTFHQEGFPMVIFNAMANGLPIITTKIRAAADYLKEPENVLWTKPQDSKDLSDKIRTLYQQTDLLKQMSDNNFNRSRDFTAEKIAPEYLEIYSAM